jgi:hypothetical protein
MRPMVGCLAALVLVPALAWAQIDATAGATADPTVEEAARGHLRRAVDALEIGDRSSAQAEITALLAARPGDVAGIYLRAHLAADAGDWETAFEDYQRLLTRHRAELTDEWFRLVSGRWVRARHARDAMRARTALAREEAPPPIPGRTLVLPLEPLLLGVSTPEVRAELTAIGEAIAAWVIRGLGEERDPVPPAFHETALLRRGQVPLDAVSPRAAWGAETVPPVSTLEGAAYRLRLLEPQGPPPWSASEPRPARYLAADAGREQTREISRAVAHFQSEHELSPTGILDPETRAALERAFRDARAQRTTRAPTTPGDDPVLGAARLAQVDIVMTGTLEPLDAGSLRWDVAWVSAADGRLLGEPVSGVLSRRLFPDAWQRMLSLILAAHPQAAAPRDSAPVQAPPGYEGARYFGEALGALEAGEPSRASELFALADRAGAGPSAAWLAGAWGITDAQLVRAETRLLRAAILGPMFIKPTSLRTLAAWLARDLALPSDAPGCHALDLEQRGSVANYPEQGWLQVKGHLEP